VLVSEHPYTATSLNNLAYFYDSRGRYEDAEPLYRRAVAIAQKALRPQHPDTITIVQNLIDCYRSQGKRKEAEELEQQLKASN
jgi:Flp pilus assembly protein TadD